MKTIKLLSITFLLSLLFSCEQVLMHPNPGEDNLSIFDEYTKICREKYGLFEVKGLNFDTMVDSLRPTITDELSQKELFNILGTIANQLQEGHTCIEDEVNDWWAGYYYYKGYPVVNSTVSNQIYYNEEVNPSVKYMGSAPQDDWRVKYGRLQKDSTIGFIRISSFNITYTDADLDAMMTALADTRGLVIDVRTNPGGYVEKAAILASCFTDKDVTFATNKIKNGPGKDDFASSKMVLQSRGGNLLYTKPIMLLQDRVTFSSGSLFSIMLSSLDHVTTLGQTFGGGTGNIMTGYLANGWKYTLSTSNLVNAAGEPTDNGIEPELALAIDSRDLKNDAVIDRAMVEVQKKYK